MKKQWLPKTPWLRNEMIAAKAALSKWYRLVGAHGDPGLPERSYRSRGARWENERIDWPLYAAALGRKRGILPDDLSRWTTEVTFDGYDPVVKFYCQGAAFYKPKGRRKALNLPIAIKLENMFWTPEAPVETINEEALI
jgi:hypothetical protein